MNRTAKQSEEIGGNVAVTFAKMRILLRVAFAFVDNA